MNYLSHFYFDQSNTDSYYLLGLALPDLTKNHNRRWNLHPHKNNSKWENNKELLAIEEGWKRHLAVDQLFHESEYFAEKTNILKNKFSAISFENQKVRSFLLAHVGLELILDTLLVDHKKVSIGSFYERLLSIDPPILLQFLEKNEIQNPITFLAFYERFTSVQYLRNYKGNESIVYALNRINFNLTGVFFSDLEMEQMNISVKEMIPIIGKDYNFIFEYIKGRLNEC